MRRCQLGQVLVMGTLLAACLVPVDSFSHAADLLRLSEKNWDGATPQGKEVDAIYGDWVLRNEHLVAVIGEAIEGRNANMTVRTWRLGHRSHAANGAQRSAQRLLSVGHWLQIDRPHEGDKAVGGATTKLTFRGPAPTSVHGRGDLRTGRRVRGLKITTKITNTGSELWS